jgi:hypothetical protein
MNGRDLTPDHGYPLRAIVPGYYGMSSVKWLTAIVATTQPFQGYWQTSDYGHWDDSDGRPVRRPLAEMKLKSQIARPRVYETVEPARPYTILVPHGRGTLRSPRSGSASMAAHRGFRAISSTRSTGTHGDAGNTAGLRPHNPAATPCWRAQREQTSVPSQTVTMQISAAM